MSKSSSKKNSIDSFYNTKKKSSLILILLSTAAFLIMSITSIIYLGQLQRVIKEESVSYLEEINNHEGIMIERRVSAQLKTLSMLADAISADSYNPDMEKIMTLLEKERNAFGYKNISIVTLDGTMYSTIEPQVVNIKNYPVYTAMMNTDKAMADIYYAPIVNEPSFMFIIPIERSGNILGYLMVTKSVEDLSDILALESFNGEGYIQIIDKYGNFVTHAANKSALRNSNNFFIMLDQKAQIKKPYSVENLMNDFMSGKNGFVEYTTNNGVPKFVRYKKLNLNDWYILTIVPTSVITDKTKVFIITTAVISATLILLFLLLILIVRYTQNKNRKELENVTLKDSVTDGISNSYFEYKAKKLIQKSKPSYYSFVTMDIAKFKLINDAYGTTAGNETLKYIYNTIRNSLDKDELVVRTESDHFCMLIKSATKKTVIKRLDDLKEDINSYNNKYYEKYYINFICGICYVDDINSSIIAIRDRANTARKEAKSKSENYFFYSEIEKEKLMKEKEIENMMQYALDGEEFEVYLQPKYELENNTIAGAEALVRWNNPKYGLMYPNEFIPIFEKNEFIIDLDVYMFTRVCKIIRGWIDSEIEPITISINLSRLHFKDLRFLDKFVAISREYDIPPQYIEIELTETLVFENISRLITVVNEIHKAGFTCSLDDFGSGYSALNMLKDIQVDVLKIDKIFFDTDTENIDRGNKVVESVIDLARKLNIRTVSEGVEHIPQVNFLKEANCDMIQGYIFSKPVPVDTFEKLMIKSQKSKLFYLNNCDSNSEDDKVIE